MLKSSIGSVQLFMSNGQVDMAQVRTAVSAGAVTKDQIMEQEKQIIDQMGEQSGSIIFQEAVSFSNAEIDKCGYPF